MTDEEKLEFKEIVKLVEKGKATVEEVELSFD